MNKMLITRKAIISLALLYLYGSNVQSTEGISSLKDSPKCLKISYYYHDSEFYFGLRRYDFIRVNDNYDFSDGISKHKYFGKKEASVLEEDLKINLDYTNSSNEKLAEYCHFMQFYRIKKLERLDSYTDAKINVIASDIKCSESFANNSDSLPTDPKFLEKALESSQETWKKAIDLFKEDNKHMNLLDWENCMNCLWKECNNIYKILGKISNLLKNKDKERRLISTEMENMKFAFNQFSNSVDPLQRSEKAQEVIQYSKNIDDKIKNFLISYKLLRQDMYNLIIYFEIDSKNYANYR